MEPTDLRYHEEHEWIRIDGKQATMGISNFAQDALGDIVFIDMPKVGSTVAAGQQIGEVESTKTTSSIYTPVSGKIVKINMELKDHPEVVNAEPYGKAHYYDRRRTWRLCRGDQRHAARSTGHRGRESGARGSLLELGVYPQ